MELYESSNGTQGTTLGVLVAREENERLRDVPVVILTTLGAKSGKIRKSPVIRADPMTCSAAHRGGQGLGYGDT